MLTSKMKKNVLNIVQLIFVWNFIIYNEKNPEKYCNILNTTVQIVLRIKLSKSLLSIVEIFRFTNTIFLIPLLHKGTRKNKNRKVLYKNPALKCCRTPVSCGVEHYRFF